MLAKSVDKVIVFLQMMCYTIVNGGVSYDVPLPYP